MHAVMRDYSGTGAKKLFDLLEKRKAEVENVFKPIKGFARGGYSVTVCHDKAGCDESTRAARDWIAKNARDTRVAAPTVSEGTVMLHF
jgi:hypothetical protein